MTVVDAADRHHRDRRAPVDEIGTRTWQRPGSEKRGAGQGDVLPSPASSWSSDVAAVRVGFAEIFDPTVHPLLTKYSYSYIKELTPLR